MNLRNPSRHDALSINTWAATYGTARRQKKSMLCWHQESNHQCIACLWNELSSCLRPNMWPSPCAAVVAEASVLLLRVASPALLEPHIDLTGAMLMTSSLKPSPLRGEQFIRGRKKRGSDSSDCICRSWLHEGSRVHLCVLVWTHTHTYMHTHTHKQLQ